jgi:hypothetical protein
VCTRSFVLFLLRSLSLCASFLEPWEQRDGDFQEELRACVHDPRFLWAALSSVTKLLFLIVKATNRAILPRKP